MTPENKDKIIQMLNLQISLISMLLANLRKMILILRDNI